MPWRVLDYDDTPLPGRWETEEAAIREGLCGRYLLSGYTVEEIDGPDQEPDCDGEESC